VTPQPEDEKHFRAKLGLPPMTAEAEAAWKKDHGARRPITLAPPPGDEKPQIEPTPDATAPDDQE
jgi:hypothetical protein